MASVLDAKHFKDEAAAFKWVEARVWPAGRVCPHCGTVDNSGALRGKSTRIGVYKCYDCRKPFTVKVGTIFEDSHIPIGKWLMAIFLLCSSKKGMSAHQIHRMLKITYRSAWFMMHRLRYAMGEKAPLGKLLQGIVEVDETFVGGKPRLGDKVGTGYRKDSNKVPVVALLERGGEVRTKVVVSVNQKNIRNFIDDNIVRDCIVNTDQNNIYRSILFPIVKGRFGKHEVVNHSRGEYARHNADGSVAHINTCESFFSLLKRGMFGAFHHVSKEHLHRYCSEFTFRWNARYMTDGERMERAVSQASGKRLTYREVV